MKRFILASALILNAVACKSKVEEPVQPAPAAPAAAKPAQDKPVVVKPKKAKKKVVEAKPCVEPKVEAAAKTEAKAK